MQGTALQGSGNTVQDRGVPVPKTIEIQKVYFQTVSTK